MKILAIRGHNLASLAREFEVDLEAGDLGSAGIFAICGPVGAGKSTLLDALCLALFDRTPRLSGRGGVAVAEAELPAAHWLHSHDPRTLLRRGAASGYAEVDFTGRDGQRYRSRWSVRRARRQADGRIQPQELVLTDIDRGVVVAGGGKGEVLNAIRARLGLDFAQFCRSVLLAQGDFAAFLAAPADERASLLESLTGADVYRRISRAAHERSRVARQRVEQLRAQVGTLDLLDGGERAQLEGRAAALTQQVEVAEVAVELAQQVVSWYAAAAEYRREEQERTADLQRAQQDNRAAAKARERNRLLVRALPIAPRVEALTAAQQAVVAAVQREQELSVQLATERQVATELERAARAQVERVFGVEASAAPPMLVAEFERWQPTFARWLRRHAEWRAFGVSTAAAAMAERDAADAAKAAAANLEAAEFRELPARRQRLLAEREAVAAITAAVREWQGARSVASERQAELTRLEGERERLARGFDELARAVEVADRELHAAQQAAEHARIRGDLAAFREHLESGEPCPLCGSIEHPHPVDAPSPSGSGNDNPETAAVERAQKQREAARDAVAAREAERRACERALRAARSAAERAADAVAACERVAVEALGGAGAMARGARESELRERPAAAESADEPEASVTLTETEAVAVAERRTAGLADEERAVAALADRHDELRAAYQTAVDAERRAQSAGTAAAAFLEANEELAPALVGVSDPVQRLAALIEDAGSPAAGDAAVRDLVSAHEQSALAATRAATLERELVDAAAARQAREGEFAAVSAEVEAAARAAEITVGSVREAAAVGAAAVLAEQQELDRLQAAEEQARAVVQQCARVRGRHERTNRPAIDEGDAAQALEDSRSARQKARTERDDVRDRLSADDFLRRQREELAPRLRAAERECETWVALDELIGHSRGDRFAVFAQGLTLDLLLQEANRRLADLARRYRLEKNRGRDMDFVVVDLDLGGARRGLQSLSGGETFLVSLALALALATLAAPRSRVETLFLDEGFGTLDAQNLEAALGALDSLQATGCQIGIISHVDGIAERIGTVVDVEPEGSGQSRIRVRAH